MTIGVRPNVAARPHLVRFQNPGPAVPDGDGGYTQTWVDASPATLWVSVEPASQQALERLGAGSVIATATHIVRGQYHAGVTTKTRVLFGGRELHVNGVANIEERSIDMAIVATELVP
jgi:SPP1 family predicted phage head-tail adaptor